MNTDPGFLEYYGQIEKRTFRSFVRHWALSGLAISAKRSWHWDDSMKRSRVQFLYFHYVFRDQLENFRQLLNCLSVDHEFVSYSEAVRKLATGEIDRPYLAFSFDDGFKNNIDAARILKEFEATSCFFTCPGITGETNTQVVAQFCSTKLHMPPIEFMSWQDLEELLKDGHEIGSHTMNHRNLRLLLPEQMAEEIATSKAVLESRIGRVAHFAWPYGRFSHFSKAAVDFVFDHGYVSCASAERGCHVRPANGDPSELCIRRDHIKLSWPVDHVLYFLWRNSSSYGMQKNGWPVKWR